jgi:hypothetical protein
MWVSKILWRHLWRTTYLSSIKFVQSIPIDLIVKDVSENFFLFLLDQTECLEKGFWSKRVGNKLGRMIFFPGNCFTKRYKNFFDTETENKRAAYIWKFNTFCNF